MQPKILPITIDLYDHTTEKKEYILVSNDTKAYKFDFSIVEKKEPYDLSDVSVISIVFSRRGEEPIFNECAIDSVEDGKVSYLVGTSEISVAGTVTAELQFYGTNGERLTSVNFTFKVRKELDSGDGVVSDTNYPILTELIEKTATAISDTNQATSNANQKAQLAEEKATEAQAAADNANNARENIQTMWDNLSTAQQEEAEVINMRTSIARDKTFSQATDRLEEIEEEVFNPAYLSEEFTSSIHSLPESVEKGQIDVESIKGNTEIIEDVAVSTISALRLKSVGKNLINPEELIKEIQKYDTSAFVTTEDGERVIDFIPSKVVDARIAQGSFDANAQYTFKVIARIMTESGVCFRINYTDGTYKSIGNTTSNQYTTIFGSSDVGKIVDSIGISFGSPNYRARIKLDSIQLEKGTQSTPYEPYTESNMYTKATGEEGNILPMRSLPNNVKDEIYEDGGLYKFRKNVSDAFPIPTTGWSYLKKNDTHVIIAKVNIGVVNFKPLPVRLHALTNQFTVSDNSFEARVTNSTAETELRANTKAFVLTVSGTTWHITIPISEYTYTEDHAGATQYVQENLADITLTYQLDTPIIRPINVIGHLDSHPNGTVIVEPYHKEQHEYDEEVGLVFPYPIERIDKIEQLIDGQLVELDFTATIAPDGLSATIDELIDGDIVTVYAPYKSENSTIPTTTITVPLNTNAQLQSNTKTLQAHTKKIMTLEDRLDLMYADLDFRITMLGGM